MNDVGTLVRELREAREEIEKAEQLLLDGGRRRAVEHLGRANVLAHGVRRALKSLLSRRAA